jgi:hypothetical protein
MTLNKEINETKMVTYFKNATTLSSGKKYTPVFGSSAPYFFLSI